MRRRMFWSPPLWWYLKRKRAAQGTPSAPDGYVLLTDSDGAYLLDSDGAYLIEAL